MMQNFEQIEDDDNNTYLDESKLNALLQQQQDNKHHPSSDLFIAEKRRTKFKFAEGSAILNLKSSLTPAYLKYRADQGQNKPSRQDRLYQICKHSTLDTIFLDRNARTKEDKFNQQQHYQANANNTTKLMNIQRHVFESDEHCKTMQRRHELGSLFMRCTKRSDALYEQYRCQKNNADKIESTDQLLKHQKRAHTAQTQIQTQIQAKNKNINRKYVPITFFKELQAVKAKKKEISHKELTLNHNLTWKFKPEFRKRNKKNNLNKDLQKTQEDNSRNRVGNQEDDIPLWLINRRDFKQLKTQLMATLQQKDKNDICTIFSKEIGKRSLEERNLSMQWVQSCSFFKNYPSLVLEDVLACFECVHYAENEWLCRQGDKGTCMFVILAGTVDVLINGKKVAELKAKAAMGQSALQNEAPRNASIRASQPTVILQLKSEDFKRIILSFMERERKDYINFVSLIPIFSQMSLSTLDKINKVLFGRFFYKNDVVYREGDDAKSFFICRFGKLKCTRQFSVDKFNKHPTSNNTWTVKRVGQQLEYTTSLEQGSYFGEEEVLCDHARTHTVIVEEECLLLCINTADFFAIFSQSELLQFRRNLHFKKENQIEDYKNKVIMDEQEHINEKRLFEEVLRDCVSAAPVFKQDALRARLQPWRDKKKKQLQGFFQSVRVGSANILEQIVDQSSIYHSNSNLKWNILKDQEHTQQDIQAETMYRLIRIYRHSSLQHLVVLEDALSFSEEQIILSHCHCAHQHSTDLVPVFHDYQAMVALQGQYSLTPIFLKKPTALRKATRLVTLESLSHVNELFDKLNINPSKKVALICDPNFLKAYCHYWATYSGQRSINRFQTLKK